MTVYIEQLLLDEAWRRTRRRRRFLGSLAVLLAAGAIIVAGSGEGGGPSAASSSSRTSSGGESIVSAPPDPVTNAVYRPRNGWSCEPAPPTTQKAVKRLIVPAVQVALIDGERNKPFNMIAGRFRGSDGTVRTALWYTGLHPKPANAVARALTGDPMYRLDDAEASYARQAEVTCAAWSAPG